MGTDYIKRQAALNIICHDDCVECPDGGCDMYRRLKRLQAADVVEVVRCKDCKFYTPYEVDGTEGLCKKMNLVCYDDYCSSAERRDA